MEPTSDPASDTDETSDRMGARVERFDPHTATIRLDPIGDDPSGPGAGVVDLAHVGGMEVGVWDHTEGTSFHTELDEVFVVISGSVTVTEDGKEPITFGPGDVGILRDGARTTWTVHETLRKVWVSRATANDDG
ncbi:MAG TPA: cupin domain-containing protein [Acidimicrobiia bacterium]|nr:cupin domain-containing protein [Acidimicrobiia bacterium]